MKKRNLAYLLLLSFSLAGCVLPNPEGVKDDPTPDPVIDPTPGPVIDPSPTTYDWKYKLDFSKCSFVDGETISVTEVNITGKIKLTFDIKGSSDRKTSYYEPDVRFYGGNKFSILSSEKELTKIIFTFGTGGNNNEITANVGNFNVNTWEGTSKNVSFTISGSSGHRRISGIEVHFQNNVAQPTEDLPIDDDDNVTDLGVKTIQEINEYITSNPLTNSDVPCYVDTKKIVTVKGLVVGRVDLVNTTKEFGLNVSFPSKTIVADSTGIIACASSTSDGSLYMKTKDYENKPTTRYSVTGYLSMYLGKPEIQVTKFTFDQNMSIGYDPSTLPSYTTDIDGFFEKAKEINYNCAGNGYGEVVSINNLTCFNYESKRSGVAFYNFTDGSKNIRVNAYNCASASVGKTYNVKGFISLLNYAPIIIATSITSTNEDATPVDYENCATALSITNLLNIARPTKNTSTRYPEYIEKWKGVYKTTGYLTSCIQDGKYYIGIRDTYYTDQSEITGKGQARTTYKMALIENNNFWNCTWEQLGLFNPLADYINVNEPVTIYYILRQEDKFDSKPAWNILLIPDSLPELN